MDFIHMVFNLVGILLCLSWQTGNQKRPEYFIGPSLLITTLKRTETIRRGNGYNLLGLVLLLTIRPLFYWHIGSELNWTPALQVGPFALHFRSDYIGRMFIFSWLSFAGALGILVVWMLLLSILNHRPADSDSFQRFIQNQWGFSGELPVVLKCLYPLIAGLIFWPALRAGLSALDIMPEAQSPGMIGNEALVMAGSFYLYWKIPAFLILLMHVINTYVYLGNHPFWHLIQHSARTLVKPIRWIPLQIGKVDLAPVLAMPLVFFLAEALDLGLLRLFEELEYF